MGKELTGKLRHASATAINNFRKECSQPNLYKTRVTVIKEGDTLFDDIITVRACPKSHGYDIIS